MFPSAIFAHKLSEQFNNDIDKTNNTKMLSMTFKYLFCCSWFALNGLRWHKHLLENLNLYNID